MARQAVTAGGLRLPPGYEKSPEKGQESLYDREKQRQTGFTKEDHMRAVTRAWQQSDTATAFVRALSEQGYLLATGSRPYVLVDLYGGTHALARLIDDKAVKTADLRKFLGKDFPPESLPSVDEAIALVEGHRASIEREAGQDQKATAVAGLRQAQHARRAALMQERTALEARQQTNRAALAIGQRGVRDALRRDYLRKRERLAVARRESRPSGLAAFLGLITGVEALRTLLHRRQDANAMKAYAAERLQLRVSQTRARLHQERQHQAELLEQGRREKALTRIERREIAALLRDLRASVRVLARGDRDGQMPSLEAIARRDRDARTRTKPLTPRHRAVEAKAEFESAVTRSPTELPNLLAAFERATQARRARESGDDTRPALDRMTRPSIDPDRAGPSLEPGRDPGQGRD